MKYIYEFIGTFFLIFTVGMTVGAPNIAPIVAPLAIGSILAVMVFAGAHVSGGHYNPAISLAAFIRKSINLKDLWLYWIVQFVAAIVAAYLTIFFKGKSTEVMFDMDTFRVFLVEFIFTFALCFVFLNVTTIKETKGNSYYGFAIGFTVLVGIYVVGGVSSAAFNPAVAFGTTIMNMTAWHHIWVFFAANLLGGACAAWILKATHEEPC